MPSLGRETSRMAAICVCFGLAWSVSADSADANVRLGSAAFNPSPHAEGFGEVQPSVVYNGGVPAGLVRDIEWKGWGGKSATGTGRSAIYKPSGGYFPSSVRVRLKATRLEACPGEAGEAYARLLVRRPLWPRGPLGPWSAWNGDRSMCGDGTADRWKPRRGGGYCGYTGELGHHPEAKTIMAFRVGCKAARKVAKRSRRKVSPLPTTGPRKRCGRTGCRVRIKGFRCKFKAIQRGDYSDSDGAALSEPYQRVACKRRGASILWWYGHYFD